MLRSLSSLALLFSLAGTVPASERLLTVRVVAGPTPVQAVLLPSQVAVIDPDAAFRFTTTAASDARIAFRPGDARETTAGAYAWRVTDSEASPASSGWRAGDTGRLTLSADGRARWDDAAPQGLRGHAEGLVTSDGQVIALDPADGRPTAWQGTTTGAELLPLATAADAGAWWIDPLLADERSGFFADHPPQAFALQWLAEGTLAIAEDRLATPVAIDATTWEAGWTARDDAATLADGTTVNPLYGLMVTQRWTISLHDGRAEHLRIRLLTDNPATAEDEATEAGVLELALDASLTGSAPTLELLRPDSEVAASASLLIAGRASDADGDALQVTAWLDGRRLGNDTVGADGSWGIPWPAPIGGGHDLLLRCLDDSGRQTLLRRRIVVVDDGTATPPLRIVSPAAGAVLLAGVATSIDADASAGSTVTCFVDGRSLGSIDSEPYRWSWTPSPGGHRLTLLSGAHGSLPVAVQASERSLQVSTPAGMQPQPLPDAGPERELVSLDGWWDFQPAVAGASDTPQTAAWGSCFVPGSWRSRYELGGVADPAPTTGPWSGVDLDRLSRAWYSRRIDIPAAWAGRHIELDIRWMSTDCRVFVGSQLVGTLAWPGGRIDLSEALEAGAVNEIRLLVVAAKNASGVDERFAGTVTSDGDLDYRGLIGEVFLGCRPAGAHLLRPRIQTTTSDGQVQITGHLAGHGSAQSLRITTDMRDELGRSERVFHGAATIDATDGSSFTVAWPWPDARRWDIGRPQQYSCLLTVQGDGWRDSIVQRFGFRQMRVDGRDLILNERKFFAQMVNPSEYIRGASIAEIDGCLDSARRAGFTMLEPWPWNHWERGRLQLRNLWIERASHLGIGICGIAPYAKDLGGDWAADPTTVAAYRARLDHDCEPVINEAAALVWASSGNSGGYPLERNPLFIGRQVDPVEHGVQVGWSKNYENLRLAEHMIRQRDPSRPQLWHQGGLIGDIHAPNFYLNVLPLKERMDWFSDWQQHGDRPFIGIEYGTPLYTSLGRRRIAYSKGVPQSEQQTTEYSAIFQGAQAYDLESTAYREATRDKFAGGMDYQSWHNDLTITEHPGMQELQVLHHRQTYRAWRMAGISGLLPWGLSGYGWRNSRWMNGRSDVPLPAWRLGQRGTWQPQTKLQALRPYDDDPNGAEEYPAGAALRAETTPLRAFLRGRAGDPNEQGHAFWPGEHLAKQIALINTTPDPVAASWTWELILAGTVRRHGGGRAWLPAGAHQYQPIGLRLPANAGSLLQGELRLAARVGGRSFDDRLAIELLPQPSDLGLAIGLIPGDGSTRSLLTGIGCQLRDWDGSPTDDLIVVGRRAFSAGAALPADLATHVASGGRLLILAQDPDWLREHLELRVDRHVRRQVWPVATGHPAIDGLPPALFHHWRGESELIATETASSYVSKRDRPREDPFWHWGNGDAVSSCMIEKPHRSGWRPILEGGHDLAWSPLLELQHGGGRALFCGLDFAEHRADAAADAVLRQLLRYAATAPLPSSGQDWYLFGDGTDRALLADLGLDYRQGGDWQNADCLIIGANAPSDADLQSYLDAGGRALVLARDEPTGPLGLMAEAVADFHGATSLPDWPILGGLSRSNLHLRAPLDTWLLTGGGDWQIAADGMLARRRVGEGLVLATQCAPQWLDADNATYFRWTRWRQLHAIAMLAANLGARFDSDPWLLRPTDSPRSAGARRSLAGVWRSKAGSGGWSNPSDPQDWALPDSEPGGFVDDQQPTETTKERGEWLFRFEVDIPDNAVWRDHDLRLHLGKLFEWDTTYFNGTTVGSIGLPFVADERFRHYRVPREHVRVGERNCIGISLWGNSGKVRMIGPAEDMFLQALEPLWYYPDYREDYYDGDSPTRFYHW